MAARDINARIAELKEKRESLEKRLFDLPGLDHEERKSLVEECSSLSQLEHRLRNELLRPVEPRERVAMSRVSELSA